MSVEMREKDVPAATQDLLLESMKLHAKGLARMLELAGDDRELVRRWTQDEAVQTLLLIHDLHPLPPAARLNDALARVRPYIESHGGHVDLVSFREGTVTLKLSGRCKTCPASQRTLKDSVEATIYALVPEVERIEVEGVGA